MKTLKYLTDLWDERVASELDAPGLLQYRSNLLGSDLRLTNFGGGNTSSKIEMTDPLTGKPCRVLWVKGSGGDIGSIKRSGFATLYLDDLLGLQARYQGVEHEDDMVAMYPLCTFGPNPTAASIDTPLHGLLPFLHVDHLHPDWAIALAASANAGHRLAEFNQAYGHSLLFLPWQRPGFELGLMLQKAIEKHPNADGIVLGAHGLFTWGETQRSCYVNTLTMVDDLGKFVLGYVEQAVDALFGGVRYAAREDRATVAGNLLPFLRGALGTSKRVIAHYHDASDVLRFVNSNDAGKLARLGTSCPDHFIRTKIRPLMVDWNPSGSPELLPGLIKEALASYREEYANYHRSFARPDSPAMRDPNPSVVLIPGVGMFSFGKNKPEARITGEFYLNAIHVMEGATALDDGAQPSTLPQAGNAAPASAFTVYRNYVALPTSEAFRIEYWNLEEAKLRRQPAEKEFSRQVVAVIGGANGIGKATAEMAMERGAHVVVIDRDADSAKQVASQLAERWGKELVSWDKADIRDRESVRAMLLEIVFRYGGLDVLVNTAAMFPASPDGVISDDQWRTTLDVNVTANYILVDEVRSIFSRQGLPASIVLTSSANAVVPKRGSEAYDVSKAAVSHLVRELAISMAPFVRVNGISPATVVKGSTMFPRDRVIASLKKYDIPFENDYSDDELRSALAAFYAKRTLTHASIDPNDCAEAILFLAGNRARCTTGHLIPVDGGLGEAFLR